ncbi:hypothetical protein B0A48_10719 [Cryoendolithus antarcticus]|uniref:Uncharacterized protein n=1 Tax=Cryoendolithus antarcticus TaxID=1507870 RepID=A0A1V8SYG0_9PEZI|nr:hypothetical protein B0A48_10719 [Cryoendolithus antarcticus]
MSVTVQLKIKPADAATTIRTIVYHVSLDLADTKLSGSSNGDTVVADNDSVTTASNTKRGASQDFLDENLEGEREYPNVLQPSDITVNFGYLDGRTVVLRKLPVQVTSDESIRIDCILTKEEVGKLLREEPPPSEASSSITRHARFFSLSSPIITFDGARLHVAPVPVTLLRDKSETLRYVTEDRKTAVKSDLPAEIVALDWTEARLAIDGTFTAQFPQQQVGYWSAWAWLLTGSSFAAPHFGYVKEELLSSTSRVRSILLVDLVDSSPKPSRESSLSEHRENGCICERPHVPAAASEAELASNPEVYGEDPGAFCKPFRNPARIVSERAFFSVMRIGQPEISAEATIKLREPA